MTFASIEHRVACKKCSSELNKQMCLACVMCHALWFVHDCFGLAHFHDKLARASDNE
jgi:hypothetical protein